MFGDGQTSVNANPSITYLRFDVYTVKLTITYTNGCIETVTKIVPVTAEPEDLIITNDTSICRGDSVVFITRANGFDSCWETSGSLKINAGKAVAKPMLPTSYIFNARKLGDNLVSNGDFSSGNTSFSSEYLYNKNSGLYEGYYTVAGNPRLWHPAFSACGDHTTGTGNMMIVNGATEPNRRIWAQTIPVAPNSNYLFSTWLESVAESYPPNPASLQFSINGLLLGNPFVANLKPCNWQQFYSTWNSGSNTTATIQVVNMDTIAGGNDFALDDIFFGKITLKTDTVKVSFKSAKVNNITAAICPGQSYKLPSGVVVNSQGAYVDTLTYVKCDTLITRLQLLVNKPAYAASSVEICAGNSYRLPSGKMVKTTGVYLDTLRYSNGCDSIITTVNLNVKAVINRSILATVCSGQSYTMPSGKVLVTSGVYKDTLRYTTGCDSLITTVALNVQPVYTSVLLPVICEGQSYILPSGVTQKATGVYKDTLRYSTGCDSLITTVHLTVQKVIRKDTSLSICAGQLYIMPSGKSAKVTGVYRDTLRYKSGCDSLITTTSLTVKAVTVRNISATICNGQSYTMPSNKVLVTSGIYKDTLHYTTGCDSLITILTLLVQPLQVTNIVTSICEGQLYKMPSGMFIKTSGTYKDTLHYASGCDSVVSTVTLIVQKVVRKDTSVYICSGSIYILPSRSVAKATGVYHDTLRYTSGCDSLITTVHLTVKQVYVSTIPAKICEGDLYTLPAGRTVYSAGIYIDTIKYISSGCDSLITTTNLALNTTTRVKKNVSVCYGQNYVLPSGVSVNKPGTYSDTAKYSNGCDSIITSLTVSIETPVTNNYSIALCTGQSYKLPTGKSISTSGIYNDTLRSQIGCDSLITIVNLSVTVPTIISQLINLCEGDSFTLPWGGAVTTSGVYRDTLKSIMNCDSIITTIRVVLKAKPVVKVTKSNDIDCSTAFTTLAVSNIGKYKWMPASMLDNAQVQQPKASPLVTTIYKAQVISKDGCMGEDSIEVKVLRGNTDQSFYVPGAFTPNNDGKNDYFGVRDWSAVTNLMFSVFNRWGVLIFQSANPSKCWDGTYKSVPQSTGAFVYQISANTPCGPILRKGTVMLIR